MDKQEKQKRSEYIKNYRKNNPDKVKQYAENEKLKIKSNPEYAEKLKEKNRKWKEENPDKVKGYAEKKPRKEYYAKNRDIILERNKKWKEENKQKVNESRRRYYQKSKNKEGYREKINEKQKKYRWERQQVDTLYKLTCRIRTLLSHSITKKGYLKTSKTKDILGIDYEGFKTHLESQFEPWMNWDNYGKYKIGVYNYGWDIDHIIPASIAKTEEELINLNHYTNLKPLCSKTNRDIKKNNLITD